MLTTLALTALAAAPLAQEAEDALAAPLEEKLLEHSYFREIAWQRQDTPGTLLFYVQKHPLERAGYAESLADFYGRWAEELSRVFTAQIAEPAGIARRLDRPPDALFLLVSEGDYFNYRKLYPTAKSPVGYFDHTLGMTVAYQNAAGSGDPAARRSLVLRPFVDGLLHAHFGGQTTLPRSWLVREGVAGYLLAHAGNEPSVLRQRQILPRWLEALHGALTDGKAGAIYLPTVTEMVAAPELGYVWAGVERRARDLGQKAQSVRFHETTLPLPALWVHYLIEADGGNNRAAFFVFFDTVMRGGAPSDAESFRAFKARFQDLADLERSFWTWVLDENLRVNGPTFEYEETTVDALFAARAALVAQPPPPSASEDEAEEVPQALDVETLRPDEGDVLARHALALQRALAGDVAGALAEIEELLAVEADGPSGRRLEREALRLRGLRRVRDGFLAHLADAGGRLKLTRDGRKLAYGVTGFAGGVVRFDGARGLDALPAAEIPPYDLAVDMSRYLSGSDDAWLRYYVYVLAEDERWQRLLKPDSPEETELRDDANEWYPGLLRLGRVARALEELADAGVPGDQVAAGNAIDAAAALVGEHGELELVQTRRDVLRALAAESLEFFYDGDALSRTIGGKLERLDDENVRLTYEFESGEEMRDFLPDPGYLKSWRDQMASITTSEEDAGYAVEHGAFAGNGSVAYRHFLRLEAPITLRAEVEWGQIPSGGAPEAYLWFAICADDEAEDAFVLSGAFGSLVVRDTVHRFNRQAYIDETIISPNVTYEVELMHTGEEIASHLNGERIKVLEAGPVKAGGVLILAHSDTPVRIERLELRGVLSETEAYRLRRDWIESELERLGL